MRAIRDTTVTIHPTVRTSTIYALELIAEEKKMPIGKVLEICLEEVTFFRQARDLYHNKGGLSPSLFDPIS